MASSNIVSRRTFLGSGAAVAAVSSLSGAHAEPASGLSAPALPAPIAALPGETYTARGGTIAYMAPEQFEG